MENTSRNWLMAGVVSGHWSSDEQLREVSVSADALGLHWQMHLLESAWQARDNARQPEGSLVHHLAALGVLSEGLSCAHCVQTDADDFAVLAENDVSVVHNFSSNLRLESGVAPVAAMRDAGAAVALGLDSMDFDDRADMFDEMRRVHRHHGVLTAREVLCMATINGAKALGRAKQTGRLLPGYRADFIVLERGGSADPAPRSAQEVPDWIIASATPEAIRQVFVDGEAVIENGRHASLDEDALVAELLESTGVPATPADRLALFAGAAPHIRALLSERP